MDDYLATRYHLQDFGTGTEPLLFLHGFASNQNTWGWVTPAFTADYRIIQFDFVGSGASDRSAYDPNRYDSLVGYANDVIDVCNRLELNNLTVIAHSVGGLIALLASTKQEGLFKKIIVIGASPCYLEKDDYHGGFTEETIEAVLNMMEENFLGWASYLAPVALPASEGHEKTDFIEKNFRISDPEVTYNFFKVTMLSDYRSILSSIRTPTVILQCANDSFVPEEVAYFMHKQLPDSKLHILEAIGHYPHVSQPKETIAAIRTYL